MNFLENLNVKHRVATGWLLFRTVKGALDRRKSDMGLRKVLAFSVVYMFMARLFGNR